MLNLSIYDSIYQIKPNQYIKKSYQVNQLKIKPVTVDLNPLLHSIPPCI